MRVYFWIFAAALICGIPSAMAGITVSSYDTSAQANAYAPLDKSQYYDLDDHPNDSPATASISDNWSGSNIGGTETTWNMVASAQANSMTTIGQNSLTMTGGATFTYNITTTPDFVDPTSVTTLYGPGALGGFGCTFQVNTPTSYAISGQLLKSTAISLSSSSGIIFQKTSFGALPVTVNTSGVLQPGQYNFAAGADQYGPSGLPAGVNNVIESGNISNVSFALQVPEPTMLWPIALIATIFVRRLCAR